MSNNIGYVAIANLFYDLNSLEYVALAIAFSNSINSVGINEGSI